MVIFWSSLYKAAKFLIYSRKCYSGLEREFGQNLFSILLNGPKNEENPLFLFAFEGFRGCRQNPFEF